MISSSGMPEFQSSAISALESASTEATDRSISAAMITSVSASAISATSERSSEPVVNESAVRNSLDRPWPNTNVTTIRPSSSASQRPSAARRREPPSAPASVPPAGAAAVCGRCGVSRHGVRSSCEGRPRRGGDEAVEGDGQQQQGADRGLLPERVDLEHDQRRGDRAEQQRAQRGAVDAADAAEDRHAADDGGRDHGQLVADAGGRVDRAEAGGEQHAAEAGQRAREHERGEHPALRAHAGQARALGVGADRVQLAAGAVVAQPLADDTITTSAISTRNGIPSTESVPRFRNASGSVSALTWVPLVHRNASPRKMYSVPSVTTSAGTCPQVTRMPLNRPHAAPSAIPSTNTTGIGSPGGWTAGRRRRRRSGRAPSRPRGRCCA